jgi:hypothetical protein
VDEERGIIVIRCAACREQHTLHIRDGFRGLEAPVRWRDRTRSGSESDN